MIGWPPRRTWTTRRQGVYVCMANDMSLYIFGMYQQNQKEWNGTTEAEMKPLTDTFETKAPKQPHWPKQAKQALCVQHTSCTVPIRRKLTGNAFANGNGTDTEQVQNGYRTNTERIQNGYRMEMEQIRNGYKSQKWKKAFSRMQTIRERVLQNTW